MTSASSELVHRFRQLKAPAAASALPKLADRARAEEWSYEQFAAARLKTETDSRDSHGRVRRARPTAPFEEPSRPHRRAIAFSTEQRSERIPEHHRACLNGPARLAPVRMLAALRCSSRVAAPGAFRAVDPGAWRSLSTVRSQ